MKFCELGAELWDLLTQGELETNLKLQFAFHIVVPLESSASRGSSVFGILPKISYLYMHSLMLGIVSKSFEW